MPPACLLKWSESNFLTGEIAMTEDATVVFHGFLNLPNLEKLTVIEAINEYFDSMNREPIRAENEERFAAIDFAAGKKCKCCGR
jgi:hypothetical protein